MYVDEKTEVPHLNIPLETRKNFTASIHVEIGQIKDGNDVLSIEKTSKKQAIREISTKSAHLVISHSILPQEGSLNTRVRMCQKWRKLAREMSHWLFFMVEKAKTHSM